MNDNIVIISFFMIIMIVLYDKIYNYLRNLTTVVPRLKGADV